MSALSFDPWAALESWDEDTSPSKTPNPPNPPNRGGAKGCRSGKLGGLGGMSSLTITFAIGPGADGLGELGGVGRGASQTCKTTVDDEASAQAILPVAAGGHDDDESAPVPTMRLPIIPLDLMVEQMAEAMVRNAAHKIIDPERALAYCRANALTRLTTTTDPLARGLMLGWERHRSVVEVDHDAA